VPVVLTLIAGADDLLEDARSRLRGMSPEHRNQLEETLKRFDLQLPAEEQQAIRDLDQQINRLPAEERLRYLAVLRRYHNWLDSLPENVKDTLLAKPPAERLSQIRILLPKYPLPTEITPYVLQLTDLGGGFPFELAREFKIWQSLSADQQREIEKLPSTTQRRNRLLEFGKDFRIRDFRPSDFRLEDWIPKAEAKIEELKRALPGLKAAVTAKAAILNDKRNPDVNLPAHPPILRRLAINLYFLEQPPPHSVAPDRLTQFLAALPPWIRSGFDAYPSDDARRRLTMLYRLAFPYPDEFKPGQSDGHAATATAKRRPATGAAPPPPLPGAIPKKTPPSPRPPSSQPF
jgi:hypothetical protein